MNEHNISVGFANHNYEFVSFQIRYKEHCQNISLLPKNNLIKVKDNALKITNSLINEYLMYIKSNEIRTRLLNDFKKLEDDIMQDEEYYKLCNNTTLNPVQISIIKIKYFRYFIRLFEIIGLFGDELSSTFMPTKSDRDKYFRFINNNSFYEEFTKYKKEVSNYISSFEIKNFEECLLYFIGFYYAYYLFIDARSRVLIEKVFSNITNITLNQEILKLIHQDYNTLNKDKQNYLKKIDKIVHKSLLKIFFRCNVSYSLFGVMPQIQEQINIDMTLI